MATEQSLVNEFGFALVPEPKYTTTAAHDWLWELEAERWCRASEADSDPLSAMWLVD